MTSRPVAAGRVQGVRAGIRGPDAATALTVYLVLLCAVPSSLTMTALGSLGRPAVLWGLGCGLWWLCHQLGRTEVGPGRAQPVRIALGVLVALTLLSYALAQTRGIPVQESSPADSGLLRLMSLSGILLLANDGLTSRARLVTMLRRVALAGGLMAALGLVQFFTGQSWIGGLSIPGFSSDLDLSALQSRSGFTRPSATASHPLEYAVVLSAALPLAVTLALTATGRRVLERWLPVAAIAAATALSVSRSAPLGAVTGLLVLFPTWPRPVRRRAAVAVVALLGAVYLVVPGMISTLRALFVGVTEDSSTLSRTSSYDIAVDIAGRSLWLGRGFGTFLPAYRILDNQYLQTLIELGVLGLVSLLALIATAILCASGARRAATDPVDRDLAHALVASTASVGVLLAFFDAFTFPMAVGLLFLLLGLCGAARNVWGIDRRQASGTSSEGAA